MSLLIGLLIWIGCVLLAGALAGHKRRSVAAWAFAGFLFGPLGLIAIALLPVRAPTEVEQLSTGQHKKRVYPLTILC